MKSSLVRRDEREARKHMYSGIFSARSADDRIQRAEGRGVGWNVYLLDMTQEHLRIWDVSDVSIHFRWMQLNGSIATEELEEAYLRLCAGQIFSIGLNPRLYGILHAQRNESDSVPLAEIFRRRHSYVLLEWTRKIAVVGKAHLTCYLGNVQVLIGIAQGTLYPEFAKIL